jgi:hypothetical protein
MVGIFHRKRKAFHKRLPLIFSCCLASILSFGCSGSQAIPDTGLGGLAAFETTPAPELPHNEQSTEDVESGLSTPIQPSSQQLEIPADEDQAALPPYPYPLPDVVTPFTPTPTSSPTPDPTPTQTPTTAPTHTPTPNPTPFRLTEGGCCPQPFWSSDSESILFIGSPLPGSETGLWRVPLSDLEPEFVTSLLGVYSPDISLAAFPLKGQTLLENFETGEIWLVANGGRKVYFSPDGSLLAWTEWKLVQGKRFLRPIWVSDVDGSEAREIMALYGRGFTDWFPDDRLLVHGRLEYEEDYNSYWVVSIEDGSLTELSRGFRLNYGSVSPDGGWMAYHNVLDPDPEENGLWIVNTETLERLRLEVFGPFQWRSEGRLVVIPLDVDSEHHSLIELDVESGRAATIVDPEIAPLKIAGGDWTLSPDGSWLAYISADDFNIWVLKLP